LHLPLTLILIGEKMFNSINDSKAIKNISGDGVPNVKIWHTSIMGYEQHPEFMINLSLGQKFANKNSNHIINAENINETHVSIGEFHCSNLTKLGFLDDIFHVFQGEVWSPNGEANNLIREKGASHTSMSIGDIIQLGTTLIMVDIDGFTAID
jgi:hypothetical protein